MKLKITLDNKTYEVEVEAAEPEQAAPTPRAFVAAPTSLAAAGPAFAPAAAASVANEDKVCRSPIAGIVVKVNAQAGQTIQSGDTLLVLEAMKMETNITAPVNGKVAKLNVANGDSVQNGQVLVEFE